MLAASSVLNLLALVLDTWAPLRRMGEKMSREGEDSELVVVRGCHISPHAWLPLSICQVSSNRLPRYPECFT